ncbi:MAG: ExeA family protein [Achromobacter veterisilvae]
MKQPLKLKRIMADLGLAQSLLASVAGYSPATIAQLNNYGTWPRAARQYRLRETIIKFLKDNGATDVQIAVAFEKETPPQVSAVAPDQQQAPINEDDFMSIRKQILHPDAMRHFKLTRNPFEEVSCVEEFYVNEQLRYTRAQLLDACRRGGFVALIGESGSGKTTLRRDLLERIRREDMQIQVTQPFVIGMESNDEKGKTLKAMHIVDALLAAIAPHEPQRASADARYRQLRQALIESYRTGMRHVVLIEEAHALPKPTLRHFKRFLELEDGYTRLLGVVLVAQPELLEKLNPRDPTVREVVQRIEIVNLPSLGEHLEDYLKFRFKRLGVELSKIVTADGLQALRERLSPSVPRGHTERSFLYPLAVHNLLTAAMNLAAENGAPAVSADIVMETKWN